jgi:hypothetical protein
VQDVRSQDTDALQECRGAAEILLADHCDIVGRDVDRVEAFDEPCTGTDEMAVVPTT